MIEPVPCLLKQPIRLRHILRVLLDHNPLQMDYQLIDQERHPVERGN